MEQRCARIYRQRGKGRNKVKQICFVCQNVDCKGRGSEDIMNELHCRVVRRNISDVQIRPYICFGGCHQGPNIVIYPAKRWYAGVKMEDIDDIVEHLAGGPDVNRLDTIDPCLKEMIFELLDAGLY